MEEQAKQVAKLMGLLSNENQVGGQAVLGRQTK